jgi:hypothetical protein
MSQYTRWKRKAEANNWPAPATGSDMDTEPGWRAAWVRYWQALEVYHASTDPNRGRPVQPHRSGGARFIQGSEPK